MISMTIMIVIRFTNWIIHLIRVSTNRHNTLPWHNMEGLGIGVPRTVENLTYNFLLSFLFCLSSFHVWFSYKFYLQGIFYSQLTEPQGHSLWVGKILLYPSIKNSGRQISSHYTRPRCRLSHSLSLSL